jgi:hypothetical protein
MKNQYNKIKIKYAEFIEFKNAFGPGLKEEMETKKEDLLKSMKEISYRDIVVFIFLCIIGLCIIKIFSIFFFKYVFTITFLYDEFDNCYVCIWPIQDYPLPLP